MLSISVREPSPRKGGKGHYWGRPLPDCRKAPWKRKGARSRENVKPGIKMVDPEPCFRKYKGGRNYLCYAWDCPLLTFIYPGVDCRSNVVEAARIYIYIYIYIYIHIPAEIVHLNKRQLTQHNNSIPPDKVPKEGTMGTPVKVGN